MLAGALPQLCTFMRLASNLTSSKSYAYRIEARSTVGSRASQRTHQIGFCSVLHLGLGAASHVTAAAAELCHVMLEGI